MIGQERYSSRRIYRWSELAASEPYAQRQDLAGNGTRFETTRGDLADRMLAALDAAQLAGGDIRGRQSAALIVVTGKPTGQPWKDRIFDLRVDDSSQPLKELRRLVTLQRAYNHMNAGDLAVEKKDNEGALREYGAAEKLVPNNAEMIYWHAVALVNMGRVDESLPLFRKVFAMDPTDHVDAAFTKVGIAAG